LLLSNYFFPQHISNGGPDVICETSPCAQRISDALPASLKTRFWDAVSFARAKCIPNLDITPIHDKMLLHVPCSAKRMGLAAATKAVASKCCRLRFSSRFAVAE
jgi:D-lactate dehydrogenase